MGRSPLTDTLFSSEISKKDRKRLAIIGAAIKVIERMGPAGITFGAVSKVLKMEPAHLVYYFPTREALLLSTFQYVVYCAQEITVVHVKSARTPSEQVSAIVNGAFEHVLRYPEHRSVIAALLTEAQKEKTVKALCHEIREAGFARLSAALAAQGKTSVTLARSIHALITGLIIELIIRRPDEAETNELRRICLHSIQVLLHAE